MGEPALYDPGEVFGSAGPNPILMVAEGTFIVVERNEDTFKLDVGAQGEGARTRSRNKSGTITITLMQDSPTNDVFTAYHSLDELTGRGVFPFFLKDNLGRTRVVAENCWVRKPAKIEFGKDRTNREWVLETDSVIQAAGGANIVA